jgi:hypothetical protein
MTDLAACCSSCAGTTRHDATALAVACTLDYVNFPERIAAIRNLAERALVGSRRRDLELELTYRASAFAEVTALVAKEQECCAFLDFDLQRDGDIVRLIVVAPESARLAAEELFAHFTPKLATVTA